MPEPSWYQLAHAPRKRAELSFEDYETRGYSHAPNRAMVQGDEQPDRPRSYSEDVVRNASLSHFLGDQDRAAYEERTRQEDASKDPRAGGRLSAFGRSATTSAADALAAPVVLPAKALEALGYRNKAAHLSADEAFADAESLARGETTHESRERARLTRDAHPTTTLGGKAAGEALAALAVGGAQKAAPAVKGEATRAFGGSRASQRGVVVLDDAEAGPLLKKLIGGKQDEAVTDSDVSRLVGHHPVLGDEAATETFVSKGLGNDGVMVRKTSPKAKGSPKDSDFELIRSYERGSDGKLVAHHDVMNVPEGLRKGGIGKKLLQDQFREYDRLGVSRVEMLAAEDGRAVWPHMGFELKHPNDFALQVRPKFNRYLESKGVRPSTIKAANLKELAETELGKEFLNSKVAPMLELTVDLEGPSGDAVRRYLGVPERRSAGSSSTAKPSSNAYVPGEGATSAPSESRSSLPARSSSPSEGRREAGGRAALDAMQEFYQLMQSAPKRNR